MEILARQRYTDWTTKVRYDLNEREGFSLVWGEHERLEENKTMTQEQWVN